VEGGVAEPDGHATAASAERSAGDGERPAGDRRPWRDQGFVKYLTARTVSILGDRFTELALPLIVLTRTGSALDAGLVGAAAQIPAFIIALFIGEIVDRGARRWMMAGADLTRMALVVLIGVLTSHGHPSVWLLTAIAFFIGLANLAYTTAATALLPSLVARDDLMTANTVLEAGDAASSIGGPGVAGVVIARFGAFWAFAADGLSFLISALLLVSSRPRRKPGDDVPADVPPGGRLVPGRLGRVWAGVLEIWRRSDQRLLLTASLLLNAQSGAIILMVVALVKDSLHLSATALGIVIGGAGVGALASSFAVAPRLHRVRWGPCLGVLLAMAGAAILLLAASTGAWVAFLGNLAMDAMISTAYIVAATMRQRLTADRLLGRVASTSFVITSCIRAVSVVVAGGLIISIGARGALLVYAMALLAGGALIALPRAGQVRLNEATPR